MNDNPNTNNENNIDDILEILKKRREQTSDSEDMPTRVDTQIVNPASVRPNTEVQQSMFDTTSDIYFAEAGSLDTNPVKKTEEKVKENGIPDQTFDGTKDNSNSASEKTETYVQSEDITSEIPKPVSKDTGLPAVPPAVSVSKPKITAPASTPASAEKPLPAKADISSKMSAKSLRDTEKKSPSAESVPVSGTVSLSDFDSITRPDSKKTKRRGKKKFYVPGYVKVILYLAIVLTISVFISASVIYIGNDIFAFKKPEKDYNLSLTENPSWDKVATYFYDVSESAASGTEYDSSEQYLFGDYATLDNVANALYESGVIEYPDVFKIYAEYRMDGKGYYTGRFIPGNYTISNTGNTVINYDYLINMLAENKHSKEIVTVTIPEGYCVYEILDLLESNHVIDKTSREKLVEKLNSEYYNYNFLPKAPEEITDDSPDRYQHLAVAYSLLSTLEEKDVIEENDKVYYEQRANEILDEYSPVKPKIDEEKIYNLEGFLFPDTYEFYVGEDLDSIVNKFLTNFQIKYEDTFYSTNNADSAPNFEEIKDVIVLASIIQAEGGNSSEFYLISQVFHNRLNNPHKIGRSTPILESDATSVYVLQGSKKRSEISADEIRNIDSPFNTYRNEGLPPGPICNPGHDAIHAALYPANYITTVDENGNSQRTYVEYYYFYAASSNGKTYFSETMAQHNAFIEADMRGDVEELERLQNQVNR